MHEVSHQFRSLQIDPAYARATNLILKLANRIAHYLKRTAKLKLTMETDREGSLPRVLQAYSNADFTSDKVDRKAMTGGMLLLNRMAVSWGARKQGGVSLSTMEADFVAASEVAHEMLDLREMLSEIGVEPGAPLALHVDKQAALSQIAGGTSSLKAKHVDAQLKFF